MSGSHTLPLLVTTNTAETGFSKCCHALAKCRMEVERWGDNQDIFFLLGGDMQATCLL